VDGGGNKRRIARGRIIDNDEDDDSERYGIKIEPLKFILLRSVESKIYACV
jgi:hypothetical protein